ncbi:MAG: hypothetical protein ACOCQQ_02855 [Candidatus Nanoarchaeia archaeon]
MNKSLLITCLPDVPLSDFHAFHVGENKQHLDTGALSYHFSKTLLNRIESLPTFFKNISVPVTLVIPGFVIEILHKHYPLTNQKLAHFIAHAPVELALVPFYNTSLHIMDDEELQQQLDWHMHSCVQQYAKKPKVLFSQEHLSSWQKRFIQKKFNCLVPSHKHLDSCFIVPIENASQEFLKPAFKELFSKDSSLKKSFVFLWQLVSQNDSDICNLHPNKKSVTLHPLQKHVIEELSQLKPYILQLTSSQQNDLLKSWRLLLQPSRLQNIHPQTASINHSPYEMYAQVMHMCADVATTILSTANARQGKIYNTPVVSDSPSQEVKNFFKQHMNNQNFTSFLQRNNI